jgi:thiamine-phosphate pyrophosphorylase
VNDFPLIYLITDGEMTAQNFSRRKLQTLELIKVAVQNNISLVQIREKKLPARLVFEFASEAAEITRNTSTKLLVNDRADIALAVNADGVHLTSRSLSAKIVRRAFPKNFIVGVSTHTIEEAENVKKQRANFITFSPIFSTPNKGEPQTVENLREVCEKLKPFPIIALGGIDAGNFSEVLDAGASGFAAIRFLNDAENIRKLSIDRYR